MRFEIARCDAGRLREHEGLVGVEADRPPGAALEPVDDVGRRVAERELGRRLVAGDSAGDGDDLLDEVDHLLDLGVQVADHLRPLAALEVGVPAQHVEVGADARERGLQLVPGVLHESALLATATGPATRACR